MTSSFVRLLRMLTSRKAALSKRRQTFKRRSTFKKRRPPFVRASKKTVCTDKSSNTIYCLRMINGKTNKIEWYFIKVPMPLDSEKKIIDEMRDVEKKREGKIMQHYGTKMVFYHSHDEKPNVLYPRVSLGEAFATSDYFQSPGFAVLGSLLFFVGGSITVSCASQFQLRPHSEKSEKGRYHFFSTDVQCCKFSVGDLSISSVSHISGMKYPRMDPLVLVLDSKLYILGGLEKSADEKAEKAVWIEAFDPAAKNWDEIPNPPVKDMHSLFWHETYGCAALEHSKEILLATKDEICFFSVEKKAWHKIIRHGKEYVVQGQGITIGQTPYWFYNGRLRLLAYDVQTGEWMSECMTALSTIMRHHVIRMARGNGDSLCLIWRIDSELHCFHFRVSYVRESSPFADVQFCIRGDISGPINLENCWFVGEESVSTES